MSDLEKDVKNLSLSGIVFELQSIEGPTFKISKEACLQAINFKDMVEDLGDASTPIPVKISSGTLANLVEFMEHYRAKDANLDAEEAAVPTLDDWDKQFMDRMTDDDIISLANAANTVELTSLRDVICVYVAGMISGTAPEELRAMLTRTDKPVPEDLSEGINWVELMKQMEADRNKGKGKDLS